MTNQHKHMDVARSTRRMLKAGAILTAAGAMVVLLSTGAAGGQTTMPTDQTSAPAPAPVATPLTSPAPTTQPSMIADGVGADNTLRLTPGKSSVINLKHMFSRVSIGTPDIADYNKISPSSLLITAKKAGSTAMVIFDDDNRSVVIDLVVDPDFGMLRRQLKETFPGIDIEVTPLNDTIALRGNVPNTKVAEQIVEMAATYAKVHNFLDIAGGQQVMLQVRFAEVSKTAMRSLGVTFGGTDGITSVSTNGLTNAANAFTGTSALGITPAAASTGVTLFGQGRFGVAAFDYFVSALRTNGLVRVLAEPNLMTSCGQTASFLAGGQIPIPVPQPGNGGTTITIEYHDYGVRLNFTPQMLGNGKIRLQVTPEVSDLDYSTAVSVGGTSVPGFTDRKVDTTVELGDGQSFALAGLLDNKTTATSSAIPVLGDIPVLGALFRSVNYQRSETELVILVTPRLVAPMNPEAVPSLPGERWRYPTQAQLYLREDLGGPLVEKHKRDADKPMAGPPPQFHGSYGFTAVGSGSVTSECPEVLPGH